MGGLAARVETALAEAEAELEEPPRTSSNEIAGEYAIIAVKWTLQAKARIE
jgi:hypothetical protein